MLKDFFYDGQVRRFITQFMRLVSNIQVEFGKDRNGAVALQRVPVYYGDSSRQVASILKNNSESTLSAVPAMAVYVSSLSYDRERVQDPFLVSKVRLRERLYDPATGQYKSQQGDVVSIDRPMPTPYKLTLKLDIWTSNTEQKLQLLEQLMVMFNPAMEIQNSDNYVDWGSLSAVFLTDMSWSSRTVPVGTEEPIDIATMTFEMPIWISAPVAVKKFGAVAKMVMNLYDSQGNISEDILDNGTLFSNRTFGPLRRGVLLTNNTLILLKPQDIASARGSASKSFIEVEFGYKLGTTDSWPAFFDTFGHFQNGISQVKLRTADDHEIVGTVTLHPTDTSKLLFSPFVDTLPANTLRPINAIIDPLNVIVNSTILNPAEGTRYLLLHDIGQYSNLETSVVWHGPEGNNFVAHANDIIEYKGGGWIQSFNSRSSTNIEYVTNPTTQIQYRWHDDTWLKSVEGEYPEGSWTLSL